MRLPPRERWRRLGGGSICDVWAVELDDGKTVVVKETPYPAAIEADGLRALAAAGTPVPEVLAVEDTRLILEHVSGPPDWPDLGKRLAAQHASTGPAYGWPTDNRIGPLVQHNGYLESWPEFFAQRRVLPYLDAPALPEDLLGHRPPASLVHGDLWIGNVIDGRWLIDPAVHHADREYELAFAALFGGFPDDFWAAYEATWPLPEGWRRRRPALQLPHLLVHVKLFGAGYVGAVAARVDALGW